jgi:parallel beta-helix repeat protein
MKYLSVLIIVFLSFYSCSNNDKEVVEIQNHDNKTGINEIYIYCNESDLNGIFKNYADNKYIPVTVVCKGVQNKNARMRIRGDTSREFPKKCFKIKLDSGPLILGTDVLNLNAEYKDPSYIHQYLASRLMNEAGLYCFKSEHIRLFINNQYTGLYLLVENVDDEFLKKRGLDKKANLYKAAKDGSCLSVYDNMDHHWENKTNEFSDKSDLQNLINTLDTVEDIRYYDFAKKTFDYEKMITIILMNAFTSNQSTWYHNYYMYHDINNSQKWTMLPWDLDKTFSRYGNIYFNQSSDYWQHDNPFLEKACSNERILQDISVKLDKLTKTVLQPEYIISIIDSLEYLLVESVKQDTADEVKNVDTWRKQLTKEREFVKNRANQIRHHIKNLPLNFKVIRTPEIIGPDYIFRWNKSKNPRGKEIKYRFIYNKDHNLSTSKDMIIIDNLTDTFLRCPAGLENTRYFWKVKAYNDIYPLDGYDSRNYFWFKKGTELPSKITRNLTLTEEGSPYYIKTETQIEKNVQLKVEEGVEIRFHKGVNLFVFGSISVTGTKEKPVKLLPDFGQDYWGYIYIISPDKSCSFKHTKFIEGHLYSKNLDLKIENTDFLIEKKDLKIDGRRHAVIWLYTGTFSLVNSKIISNGTGEGLNINKAHALVENCLFDNAPDAIEYIDVYEGVIKNNQVLNSPDDAIDMNGCKNIIIEKNFLSDNLDKGISVGHEGNGPCGNIIIKDNVIINSKTGIAVKDSSQAIIINNTLYKNDTGIRCYHKDHSDTGGTAYVINTIICNSVNKSIEVDRLSKAHISYCLSNTDKLEGLNNFYDNPLFYNELQHDFHLLPGSPAIGLYDPKYADISDANYIGAFPVKQVTVSINEFCFISKNKSVEWIELVNNSNHDINLQNWTLTDESNDKPFIFPPNTVIRSKGYIVICRNTDKFKRRYRKVENVVGDFNFKLSSTSDSIILSDQTGKIIQAFNYNFTDIKQERDKVYYFNSLTDKWKLTAKKGTPGKNNVISGYTRASIILLIVLPVLLTVFILRKKILKKIL